VRGWVAGGVRFLRIAIWGDAATQSKRWKGRKAEGARARGVRVRHSNGNRECRMCDCVRLLGHYLVMMMIDVSSCIFMN
jgi:hypothetical protein